MSDPDDDRHDDFERFEKEVIRPLRKARRFGEISEAYKERLDGERDAMMRRVLLGLLASTASVDDRTMESLAWTWQEVEEAPEEPRAWQSLSTWYLISAPDDMPKAHRLDVALRYNDIAMEKARASGTWIRYTLFDRCRVLRDMVRWDQVAETMEAILKTLPHRGELDFPYLEYDWLKRAPEDFGCEDDLWNRYHQACKETRRIFFDEKGGWTGKGLFPEVWQANDG